MKKVLLCVINNPFNPLPTDDTFWCHQILATCYQLAQSVLKIGSAVAERVGQGEVGGSTALPDCMVVVAAACRKALVNDGWAICLRSCTNGCRKPSFHLVGTPFLAI